MEKKSEKNRELKKCTVKSHIKYAAPKRDKFVKSSYLCFGAFGFHVQSHEAIFSFVSSPSEGCQIVLRSVVFAELLSCLLHFLWVMVDCLIFLGFVIF